LARRFFTGRSLPQGEKAEKLKKLKS